ncbi:MAG: hypothetical protein KC996_11720 [Phycisphaerales bacterium]|nr:hypothetical protein [Phycisphaerales bacterium]
MTRSVLLPILLLGALLGGCSSTPKFDPRTAPPPIAASELIRVHNERVAPLDQLWTRVSVRAEGRDPRGDKFREQGEGHLQIVRPDRFSLTIGKFEETYFALGANGEQYWSIDLTQSEHKTAMIGQQSLATPEKLEALGVPIHPHEMVMLLGILPIDPTLSISSHWSPDGKNVGIEVPADWGSVAFWFDAKTAELARTQAFDAAGELVASARLWRYKEVDGFEDPNTHSAVPGVIELLAVGFDGLVRIEVSGPRMKSIRPVVFKPENLMKIYRVDETIDLDEVFDRSVP